MGSNRFFQSAFAPDIPKRSHLLLLVAFFFLIGCVSLPYTTGGIWLWALAAIGAAMIYLLRRGGMRCGAGIAVLCFALGALHAHQAYDVSMPEAGSYEISGFVCGTADLREDGRITFVLGDLELDGAPFPGKAYCSLHYEEEPPELFDGAKLTFPGSVYHPSGRSGEPHMDFALWMRQQGYRFGISTYQNPQIGNTPATAPVRDGASRLRQRFSSAFERVMGPNGRIAMALLFGERSGLSENEYAAFQDLGIAHILSVSGLHVGLLGGMIMLLMDHLSFRRCSKLLILSILLLIYCSLTGFSAASLRAAVMLICTFLGRLFLRRGDRLTTLSAAMLIVLLADPLSALSAGFILSFSAMLGIILYIQPLRELMDWLWPQPEANIRRRSLKALLARVQMNIKSLLCVSLCAQLGVLLPSMRYFHQLPLYGILINLLIVPFTGSVLVPLYFLTLFCSSIPFAGALLGSVASGATDLLLQLVQLLSRLPGAVIRTAAPPVAVCIGLGAALVTLSRRVPGSLRKRFLAAALIAAVALGSWALQRPAELRYIQLDAGQADCALLLDGDKTILIDTGSDGSEALDWLRYENRKVDALILTHLHLDHTGGVPALLDSGIPIRHIYLPVHAEKQRLDPEALAVYDRILLEDIPVTTLASGDELRYNRSRIRILWPERETVRSGHDANDYPLALAVELDGFTLLNASDLTGLYERHAAVPADVLKVAHHGSRDSSYSDFLDFVDPAYALLTVSGGRRALPDQETLDRLAERGIPAFRTNECGDITLSVQNGQLSIAPYKPLSVPGSDAAP